MNIPALPNTPNHTTANYAGAKKINHDKLFDGSPFDKFHQKQTHHGGKGQPPGSVKNGPPPIYEGCQKYLIFFGK